MNPVNSTPTYCVLIIRGVDDESPREYLFKLLETLPINLIPTKLISLIGWKMITMCQIIIPNKYCNTNVGNTETEVNTYLSNLILDLRKLVLLEL